MSEKLTYTGTVKDGAVLLPRQRMQVEIAQLFEGKEIEIRIQRKKKYRSNPQNAYYWGVVVPMIKEGLKHLGNRHDENEVHDMLRLRFLEVVKIDEETGEEVYRTVKSTASLSTVEFADYIEQCRQWAAEWLGVNIPDPL